MSRRSIDPGNAFGAASTLVAQMGILLGMIVSNQPQAALVVASAASAVSGSFGDAFSMFVSESMATRNINAIIIATSVLVTKLVIGAVYVLLFFFLGNTPYLVIPVSILLTLFLLYFLSDSMKTMGQYTILTILVVCITSGLGLLIKQLF
jgi:hypothetical protein